MRAFIFMSEFTLCSRWFVLGLQRDDPPSTRMIKLDAEPPRYKLDWEGMPNATPGWTISFWGHPSQTVCLLSGIGILPPLR